MPQALDVPHLLETYRSVLVLMHEQRGQPGSTRRWNRLVNEMQQAHLQLRAVPAGRTGISALIKDDCDTVRLWSATNALAWDRKRARDALKRLAADDTSVLSFDAEMTLREFDAGRLRTDWQP